MARGGITIRPDNQGPIVNIISWILIILTFLATVAKVWSKWSITQSLRADDYYLAGATLTAAGWVAAISLQVEAGLGQPQAKLSTDQLVQFQKTGYASHFFYVTSICLAKMAILHFMLSLARIESRRLAVNCTMLFNLATLVVGIFAIAFQCPLPQPWTILSDQCINQTSFWIAFGILDILVDAATVLLPFFLLHDLRTTWKRKLPAILAFSLRFLLIPMIIIRLVFLGLAMHSTDHTHDDFNPTLTTSVHINFSVIFTCLPFLKTVIDNVQTGMLAGDLHVRGATQVYGYRPGQSGNPGAYGMSLTSPSRARSRDQGYVVMKDSGSQGYKKPRSSGGSQEPIVINRTTTITLESNRVSR